MTKNTVKNLITWSPNHSITSPKSAFTLAEGATHVGNCANYRKSAFTLAEVLITLAIIGIVAAMTIPTLISNYKKNVVETKLKKFNTIMKHVVSLSSVDNGDINSWDISDIETFYNKYLAPYLKVINYKKINDTTINVFLQDGTAFNLEKQTMIHMLFLPNASTLANNDSILLGRNGFIFLFYPDKGSSLVYNTAYCNSPYLGDGTGFVPYFFYTGNNDYWDNENNCRMVVYPTANELKNTLLNDSTYGCATTTGFGSGAYCTKLIQMNNWKIPNDYPYSF